MTTLRVPRDRRRSGEMAESMRYETFIISARRGSSHKYTPQGVRLQNILCESWSVHLPAPGRDLCHSVRDGSRRHRLATETRRSLVGLGRCSAQAGHGLTVARQRQEAQRCCRGGGSTVRVSRLCPSCAFTHVVAYTLQKSASRRMAQWRTSSSKPPPMAPAGTEWRTFCNLGTYGFIV